MKKILFIVSLVAAMFGISSCEYNVENCKYHTLTFDVPVKHNMWQWDANAGQYYYTWEETAINADVYNYGNWNVSREYNYRTDKAFQQLLPLTIYNSYNVNDSTIAYYSQLIDYRVGIGYVEFQVTNSDFQYMATEPEDMQFRVQIVY